MTDEYRESGERELEVPRGTVQVRVRAWLVYLINRLCRSLTGHLSYVMACT